MSTLSTISHSTFRKIVFQHSYFLLSKALEAFEASQYNIAVFFAITAIEEIANNLYNLKKSYKEFDIVGFMDECFPLMSIILKKDGENIDEINDKLIEKMSKYLKEDKMPLEHTIKDLKFQFRMKEHKDHNKKTLKSLLYSLSINPEAYRKLGSGLIDHFLLLAELGYILKLRNMCLYVNLDQNILLNPEEIIPKNMAVDFIAIAYESIIELKNLGKGYISEDEYLPEEMNLREKADKFYELNNISPIVYVGKIINFLNKINVIIVEIVNEVSEGDKLVIYSGQWKQIDQSLSIEKDNKRIPKAVSGDLVGIKIKNITDKKGLLFKVQTDVRKVQRKGVLEMMELFIDARKKGITPDPDKISELLRVSLKGIDK